MNVTRVVTITIAQNSFNYDLSTGWRHDALGYTVLGIAAALVYNFDYFLLGLTARVPDGDRQAPNVEFRNPVVALFNWLLSTRLEFRERVSPAAPEQTPATRTLVLCGVIAAVGIAGQTPALLSTNKGNRATFVTGLHLLTEDSLPSEVAEFSRVSYRTDQRARDSIEGEFSNSWKYQDQQITTNVSCDHVFCGWHDLRVCYKAIGWSITSSNQHKLTDDWTAMRVDMRHPDGRYGLLYFSFFTPDGSPHQPPDVNSATGLVAQRLGEQPRFYNSVPDTIQCQILLASPVPITEQQLHRVARLHTETREQLRSAMLNATNNGTRK